MTIMHRARLGVTQAELAEQLGTTTLAIKRIETGLDRIDQPTRRLLLEALAATGGTTAWRQWRR